MVGFKALAAGIAVAACCVTIVNAETLTIATVNNDDMIIMQKLSSKWEQQTGNKINWVILEENVLRQKVTTDIATKGGQYDVITIGAYETPIWGKKGWLTSLDDFKDYDYDDLLAPDGAPVEGLAQYEFGPVTERVFSKSAEGGLNMRTGNFIPYLNDTNTSQATWVDTGWQEHNGVDIAANFTRGASNAYSLRLLSFLSPASLSDGLSFCLWNIRNWANILPAAPYLSAFSIRFSNSRSNSSRSPAIDTGVSGRLISMTT